MLQLFVHKYRNLIDDMLDSGINEEDTKNLAKIERMKEMRRRRSISLSTSMNSAQSEKIKSILEESIGSKIDGFLVEGRTG